MTIGLGSDAPKLQHTPGVSTAAHAPPHCPGSVAKLIGEFRQSPIEDVDKDVHVPKRLRWQHSTSDNGQLVGIGGGGGGIKEHCCPRVHTLGSQTKLPSKTVGPNSKEHEVPDISSVALHPEPCENPIKPSSV